MELVALNHVKIQTVLNRIAEEGAHSIRARRTCVHTKFASLWQLLKMKQDGSISPEENYYLMAQLKFLPFFQEVPHDMHEAICEQITTQTYVPGCHLFREEDSANCLFLILTGQVHLRSETLPAITPDTMKTAPSLLLPYDLFVQSRRSQKFLLKDAEERLRSQTAVASLRENGWAQGEETRLSAATGRVVGWMGIHRYCGELLDQLGFGWVVGWLVGWLVGHAMLVGPPELTTSAPGPGSR
eukprot:Skav219839  [mRNA]  locus=scaffold859:228642:239198:+ [translate_table: standard]